MSGLHAGVRPVFGTDWLKPGFQHRRRLARGSGEDLQVLLRKLLGPSAGSLRKRLCRCGPGPLGCPGACLAPPPSHDLQTPAPEHAASLRMLRVAHVWKSPASSREGLPAAPPGCATLLLAHLPGGRGGVQQGCCLTF